MILVIDNYDSFTYNIVQQLGQLGAEIEIVRNDAATVQGICAMAPTHIVISPGPGRPEDSGISPQVIEEVGPSVPVLGVCLGHQAIGQVYGGSVSRAPQLMHGKVSAVHHKGDRLFAGVPSPFDATRYHSLIVEDPLPPALKVTALTEAGEVMALRHREHPVLGVQFHPESILTTFGPSILKNFLENRF